jgi:hypothetical protein
VIRRDFSTERERAKCQDGRDEATITVGLEDRDRQLRQHVIDGESRR